MGSRVTVAASFVDFWKAFDPQVHPFAQMLARRFVFDADREPEFIIYSCFGQAYRRYKCPRIFYTAENVRPNFGQCDYAFSYDYPEHDRNMRFPNYAIYAPTMLRQLLEPKDPETIAAQKSRFCNFVYSNTKCRERIALFHRLSAYKRVDAAGKLLNNMDDWRIPRSVDAKIDFLRSYKFTIAFENESYPGYTTEKILHAMFAQSIPIYWGNPLVDRDFNTRAFVNCHEYGNWDDVVARVREIDQDESLYRSYLAQPWTPDNRFTPFLDQERVLDRFQWIFEHPPQRPIAQTIRARAADTIAPLTRPFSALWRRSRRY